MSQHVNHLTDDAFDAEVLQADIPVVIDFWAEWCGPCRALGPIFEEVASEFSGKIKFMKMNVDENNQTPAKYGVRGIPTLILFKEGNVEATKVGSMSKTQLAEFLQSHL